MFSLSLSADPWCRLGDILCGLLGRLGLGLGVLGRGSLGLGVLLGLVDLLGGPDGLVPLGLPELRLLVTLGQNLVEGGADDGPLELVGPLGPLLGGLLLDTLAVLATVEHGPGHLAGVALQPVGLLGAAVQETEGLSEERRQLQNRLSKVTIIHSFRPQLNVFERKTVKPTMVRARQR